MARNYALEARNSMKAMGTYRREYERTIVMLGQMLTQYDELTKRFEEGGMQYEVQTAQGSKKAPIVTTLEALRRDILNYQSQLGLTPAGAKRIDIGAREGDAKPSGLVAAILAQDGDDG